MLDLFAGSGSLAIESLSRGAASACLVEKDPAAVETIRENIRRCRIEDRVTLTIKDAFTVLPEFKAPYNLIFLDPPYKNNLAEMAA
ncbi:MAG: methyltransferase, partial [Gammaproteobacteria bacterium]|nr:methyltransferase [Gammaproteobacteria bacterium]